MVGGQADVKLVSNAMANATRRKIMAMITESNRTQEEISKSVGPTMLDYHLQMLQQAGLVDMKDGTVILTDFGKNFMESKSEKPAEARKDLAGTKPIEIAEVRQLLPCIADTSKLSARPLPQSGRPISPIAPLVGAATFCRSRM